MSETQTACILGTGLIGGSMAAALSRSGEYERVIGWDVTPAASQAALESGHINAIADSPEAGVSQADVVILAMYVQGIIDTLQQITPHLKPGALVLDVGSTKTAIVQTMSALPDAVLAVGGHPMAGKTTSRTGGIDADLFRERIFVLTPTPRPNNDRAMQRARDLLALMGAHPLILAADDHDRQVGIISHMVRLVPIAMIATAENTGDPVTWQLAAGGFRETTRLILEDMQYWRDVIASNPHGISRALRDLSDHLLRLADTVDAGDIDSLHSENDRARDAWLARYRDDI